MSTIDQLRARLRLGVDVSDEHPEIKSLTAGDARNLRLPWLSRFNASTLARHLEENAGLSLWVPATGEHLIGEQWRHREDIANVVEVTARKGKRALAEGFVDRVAARGYRLVLLSDEAWRDDPGLYKGLGFGQVETIVFFEKDFMRGQGPGVRGQGREQTPIPDPRSPIPTLRYSLLTIADLDLLEQLDHASFPWLWWNSRAEFEYYLQLPAVYVYAAFAEEVEGQAVGYASFTMYQGWAHLDRLAVTTPYQGRKYGAAQLAHALQLMQERGARTVALSTQLTNVQSHRL